ncbi:MAG: hypothetical protein NZ898_10520 [Myxococcota bacterium]|nr:hypothetical protein [Myxococcota bacterium]MDW8363408.1 MXAN_5187 C-terminal domain-containing protein [Myxococcales bacterium]
MNVKEYEELLSDTELRVDRLRALYEQYFQGFEKLEPTVQRKEVDRRLDVLKRNMPRNTAIRFRVHRLTQKYVTYQTYWGRIARQIEEGTYRRDVIRARRLLQEASRSVPPPPPDGAFELDVDLDLDVDARLDPEALGLDGQHAPAPAASSSPAATPGARGRAMSPSASSAISGSPLLSAPGDVRPGPSPSSSPEPPFHARVGDAAPAMGKGIAVPSAAAPVGRVPAASPGGPPAPATLPRPGPTPFAIRPIAASAAQGVAAGRGAPGTSVSATPSNPPNATFARPRAADTEIEKRAHSPDTAVGSRSGAVGLDEATVRAIYERYLEARRRNNERTDNVRYETVRRSLEQMLPGLQARHAGKRIEFEVVVKDGRVGIKPVAR